MTSLGVDDDGPMGDYELAGGFEVYEYQLAIGPTFGDNETLAYFVGGVKRIEVKTRIRVHLTVWRSVAPRMTTGVGGASGAGAMYVDDVFGDPLRGCKEL